MLLDSVNGLKAALNDGNALAAAKARIETIRKAAERSLHAVELSGIEDESRRPIANRPRISNPPHMAEVSNSGYLRLKSMTLGAPHMAESQAAS